MESDASTSSLFQAPDADIVICSSDNVRFHLHKKNLECTTQGFPPADTPTNGEVVSLSESAETLEILFQFIYPRRYPDLGETLSSDSLLLVAEAAEKYGVAAAMYGCQYALKKIISSRPIDVLTFAVKHDYPSLIVELPQNFRINTTLSELADILPPHIFKPWSLHREAWLDTLQHAHRLVPDHSCSNATHWNIIVTRTLKKLIIPASLLQPDLDAIFNHFLTIDGWSKCCIDALHQWKIGIQGIVNAVPPFVLPSTST